MSTKALLATSSLSSYSTPTLVGDFTSAALPWMYWALGQNLQPMDPFETNLDRIKGVAFNTHKVGNGLTVLSSDSFE